jgi:hypothetical protein
MSEKTDTDDQSDDEFEQDDEFESEPECIKMVYCPICSAPLHGIGEDRWGCDNGHELEIFVLDENYG